MTTGKYYRVRMIMLKWQVIVTDAKDRTVHDECLGPFDSIQAAERAGIDTGLQDRDKVTL